MISGVTLNLIARKYHHGV